MTEGEGRSVVETSRLFFSITNAHIAERVHGCRDSSLGSIRQQRQGLFKVLRHTEAVQIPATGHTVRSITVITHAHQQQVHTRAVATLWTRTCGQDPPSRVRHLRRRHEKTTPPLRAGRVGLLALQSSCCSTSTIPTTWRFDKAQQ